MFYKEYTNRIKNVVAENKHRKENMVKANAIGAISKSRAVNKLQLKEQKSFSGEAHFNTTDLMSVISTATIQDSTLGNHKDFIHLKDTEETENHWIVSVFVDIKGSTNLFKDYDLQEIYMITNTIQAAEIHTVIALGGHIQRLQGDGILAYFGGRNIKKEDAVRMAMIACSFISYFVKNDLRDIFLKDGIDEISTRIGIDFGDDEDVLWANFGVAHISELTTLSLHTSLASKMQSNASPNGIVAGQYIKDKMPKDDDFFKIISENDRYIFRDEPKNFRYTQWAFDWYRFLKKQSFIFTNGDGSLSIIKHGAPGIVQPTSVLPSSFTGLATLASSNKPYFTHGSHS